MSHAISPDTIARGRSLARELDRLAAEVQALFDDASAEAYARADHALGCADTDALDYMHDATHSAERTAARLRAAVGA